MSIINIKISPEELQSEYKKCGVFPKSIIHIGSHEVRISSGETRQWRLEFEFLAINFMFKYRDHDLIGVFDIKTVRKFVALKLGISSVLKCKDPTNTVQLIKNTTNHDITDVVSKITEDMIVVKTKEFGDITVPSEEEIASILHKLKFHQGPVERYNEAMKWKM
jgi:hypothetical protein